MAEATTAAKPDPKVKNTGGAKSNGKPKAVPKPKATPKPKAETKPKTAPTPKVKAIVMGARAGRLLASMNLSKSDTEKAEKKATEIVRARDDNRIRIFDIYEVTGAEMPDPIREERQEFLDTGKQRPRGATTRPKAKAGEGNDKPAAEPETSDPPSPDPASSVTPTPEQSTEESAAPVSPTPPVTEAGSPASETNADETL